MLNVTSQKTKRLSGDVNIPGDKSISHRALLFSAIANGTSHIKNLLMGEDNLATLNSMRALGVTIIQQVGLVPKHRESRAPECEARSKRVARAKQVPYDSHFEIQGVGLHGLQKPAHPLDCGNAGTAMRLMAGLLCAQTFDSELVGDTSLSKRPMGRIVKPLTQMGAVIEMSCDGTAPLQIRGGQQLHGIEYESPMASAQVKSAILIAGLYAEGKTLVHEPGVSRDHTERMLKAFGYPGELTATTIHVPGDISSAAFFMVAATITPGSELVLKDVGVNPTRTGVITLLNMMGADITLQNQREWGGEPVADIVVRFAELHGIEIPQDQVPLAIDEFPILFIAAACATGKTVLRGARELRVKESDRIQSMADGLSALGITVDVLDDGIVIEGGTLQGGEVESFGDHRIAMSFLIAGCVAETPVTVRDCDNIDTSFPGFVELANSVGSLIE